MAARCSEVPHSSPGPLPALDRPRPSPSPNTASPVWPSLMLTPTPSLHPSRPSRKAAPRSRRSCRFEWTSASPARSRRASPAPPPSLAASTLPYHAGVGGRNERTLQLDEDEWQRVIDINLNGAYRCHKEEIGVMVGQEDLGFRQGRGVIINVASVYGLVGPQNPIHQSAYAAAKHGVLGLTKAEANSYASDNIRINAICSGYVTTPLIMDHLAADPQSPVHQQVDLTPMKRMATAEEVAENIVFLASPMSSFMHGAAIVVDGGFTSF